MNRRDFIKGAGALLGAFTILPAATTYNRLWKAYRKPKWIGLVVVNPAYENAQILEPNWQETSKDGKTFYQINHFPRRFTIVDGVLKEVPPFVFLDDLLRDINVDNRR